MNIEEIGSYIFDLSVPIRLQTHHGKFWKAYVKINTLHLEVGKLKNSKDQVTDTAIKEYFSSQEAIKHLVAKIQNKLNKGYFCPHLKQISQLPTNPQHQQIKHHTQAPGKDTNDLDKQHNKEEQKLQVSSKRKEFQKFYGGYYQKGQESFILEIQNKTVLISRSNNGICSADTESRQFSTYQEAVDFCIKEEQWSLLNGYTKNNLKRLEHISKAIDLQEKQQKKQKHIPLKTQRKSNPQTRKSNILSVVDTTNASLMPLPPEYKVTYGENIYKSSILGSPILTPNGMLLSGTWTNKINPAGWLMSQKLDGVRMYWTGNEMISRKGNKFKFPNFFTKNWPNSQLDGELYVGRGKFSQTISAVKKNVAIQQEWMKVRFLVFDAPGIREPFRTRIKLLEEVINGINNPFIKYHYHRPCLSLKDMNEQMQNVLKIKGEGIMLREPSSLYERKRSRTLLKVKKFYDDEAEVIGYNEGHGNSTIGLTASLRVKNREGVVFNVGNGLTTQMMKDPPKIGSWITYRYQELLKGTNKPRFVTLVREYDEKF